MFGLVREVCRTTATGIALGRLRAMGIILAPISVSAPSYPETRPIVLFVLRIFDHGVSINGCV